MRRILTLALVSTLLCFDALADQIILKNGDRLSGTILKSEGENLILKSEFAGEVKIKWAAVDQLSSDRPLYIVLTDGQTIFGTVTTTTDKIQVQTKEAGIVATTKEAIQQLRSEADYAAHLAEVERLRNPKLGDLWSGSADAGLSLSKGNSDTTTIGIGAQAARATPRDKISLYFASLFAKNDTTGESLTTASSVRSGLRYDFNLSKRVFAFGLSDIEYDKFQDLDLRLVLGGGLGFHAVTGERTRLDLFGGGAFNQEYFANAENRKSGEILLGEELSYKLSSSTSLAQRFVLYPNLSEIGEFRIGFDTTAVTKLSKNFGWQITLSDRYTSNPIEGIKKNDLLLTTGIRVTFGSGNK